ncbi:MAG: hypothetical protein AB1710_08300 [Pseudomonadota bacterium]
MEQNNEAVEAIAREIGLDAQEISLRKSFPGMGVSSEARHSPMHQHPAVTAVFRGHLSCFPFQRQRSRINVREFLRVRRCDNIQEFHFIRPLPDSGLHSAREA